MERGPLESRSRRLSVAASRSLARRRVRRRLDALMELELVRHLARSALQNLEAHRRRIDDLNVYPVPDGDTGTNLVLTLRSIVEALEASTAANSDAVAKDVTRAALMGARGNSGVIFSQDRARLRRGARRARGHQLVASEQGLPRRQRHGLPRGEAAGRGDDADSHPRDGGGERAEGASRHPSERAAARRFSREGRTPLARTPELLDVLRNAGVVDAGGAGLVEVARGLVYGATGEELPEAPVETEPLGLDAIHQELSEYRYCTVFVVEGDALDKDDARGAARGASGTRSSSSATRRLSRCTCTRTIPGRALALGTALGIVEGVEIANMHAQTAQREERLLEGAPDVGSRHSRPVSSPSVRDAATAGSSRASARPASSRAASR